MIILNDASINSIVLVGIKDKGIISFVKTYLMTHYGYIVRIQDVANFIYDKISRVPLSTESLVKEYTNIRHTEILNLLSLFKKVNYSKLIREMQGNWTTPSVESLW